ncbi:hypothetical protein RQP46_000547 [Phenoliferia psychrophenolica]
MSTLFRSASPDDDLKPDEPKPKPTTSSKRFFPDSDDDPDPPDAAAGDSDGDSIQVISPPPKPKGAQGRVKHEPVAGPSHSNSNSRAKAEESDSRPDWETRYFGGASQSSVIASGEAISIHRTKPDPPPPGKKPKTDSIVRFHNSKGATVGRVNDTDSVWVSKLLDLSIISFTATCVECPSKFRSGDAVVLSLRPFINATAFVDANVVVPVVEPATVDSKGKKKLVQVELKETDHERKLRERKVALNCLFDRVSLSPTVAAGAAGGGKKGKGKGKGVSKRSMLEAYSHTLHKKAMSGDDEDDDEKDLNENQLNQVYSKAVKNDATLPEMEPADGFALQLRGYQKQALKWMSSMEDGEEDARDSMSMHPLWEEYLFPTEPGKPESADAFYYNPYSGELSLDFPKASKRCGSGILADEMGLGKTIMVSALIQTNTPHAAAARRQSSPLLLDSSSELSSSSDESIYIPSPTRKSKPSTQTQRQSRLGESGTLVKSSSTSGGKLKAGSPTATLVVAPMTLLSQWCDELERSSGGGLTVCMYYGADRANVQEQIDAGVDVVVTSYGTLVSDFKASGGTLEEEAKSAAKKAKAKSKAKEQAKQDKKKKKAKGKGKASESSSEEEESSSSEDEKKPRLVKKSKPKRKGLFSIEWFRVVLDEAHLIKSRTTRNAKACYALKAQRRWCLTGTPIVNRLEDLYSLLHFIRLEPWGNHSFFRTFITVPFENKDPKALEVIQVVLESILLRREKKMKDRDGQPIVALPAKHVQAVTLKLSDDERVIYDALYKNAKSVFLGLQAEGTVMQNVTAIFSILMRLRQAVLHPSLVLKRLVQNLEASKKLTGKSKDEIQADVEEEVIRKLIARFTESRYHGGASQKAVDVLALAGADADAPGCAICFDPAEDPAYLPCDHVGCKECVMALLTELESNGEEVRCPVCRAKVSESQLARIASGGASKPKKKSSKPLFTSSTSSSGPGSSSQATEVLTIIDSSDEDEPVVAAPSKGKGKGKAKATVIDSDSDDDSDDGEVQFKQPASEDAKMGDLEDDDESDDAPKSEGAAGLGLATTQFRSSTKLDALVKSLNAIREEDEDVKAVVFSQFTGFLDLIERAMNRERFTYVRLDGSMSQKAREKVVNKLTNSKGSCVLLASLKAGGVGLNLCAAKHVYIMDCAIDRIHRFGQTSEVFVTRFLIEKSIDDKMVALQKRKTAVVMSALGGKDGKSSKQLAEDLAEIFRD